MAEQKESIGEKLASGLGCFLLIALAFGGVGVIHEKLWGEQEGYVKTEDCRATVIVKEGSYGTWFKKFTCSTYRSKTGKVIRGTCVSVATDGPVCQTVYTYEKKPQIHCSDPKFPYPGYDDMCHSDPQ